ncbi:MAG TPA: ferrochelatase [Rhodospirillaceae bacterium]|nr:ferrochelatase [Rhodospirillaceae bacterium]
MADKKQKIAVVVFNLGGPDAPEAVRPFLLNFFMDPNIIRLPVPFRCFIASMIANKRSKAEARESYDELGGSSPLLENSKQQAAALENYLNADKDNKNIEYKSFICMRYWHPMSAQVVREVRDWGADKVIFLPLYPQFSTTTTWSSLENWDKHAKEAGYLGVERSMICCYPFNQGFIEASAENIHAKYQEAVKNGHDNIRVLFSAHGLPEDVIKDGDPYQWQCEQSAQKIATLIEEKYGIDLLEWRICYQSRVGPKKWIGPSTEEALEPAAHDGKSVLIYPHAFTQEHVETLVELDVEYKEEADKMGLEGYYRAETVGTHPSFIAGLGEMVKDHIGQQTIQADGGKLLCPEQYDRCCQRAYKKPEGVPECTLCTSETDATSSPQKAA